MFSKILAMSCCAFLWCSLANAKTYSISNNTISFEAPTGFNPMPKNLLKIKYPRGSAPRQALSNKSTKTSIAFDIKPRFIPQGQIDMARDAFAQTYKRMIGGFVLKEKKTITLSGQKWLYLDFIVNTIDTKVRNIFVATGYKGKMLVFNFNATLDEFPKYQKALHKSLNSITLK